MVQLSRKAKIWGGVALGCVLVVVTVIIILRLWAGGPSTGTVHEGKPIITAKNEAPKEPLAVDTAYFTVTLPPGFTVRRQSDTPDRPIQLELVASNGHQQFAVTVGTLPSGGLEGLGDYNLRVTQTADYEPYRPAGIPIESTAFRNLTGDVGFTDFWPHGSKYAEISLTSDGAATMPELFGTFEQASHNWQWK